MGNQDKSKQRKPTNTSSRRTSAKAQSKSRRASTVYYAGSPGRCSQITSKHERCRNDVLPGGNYCQYHENMRNKKIREHAQLIKKRGGKSSGSTPEKSIFEYNYYLDDEVEPFESHASLVSSKPEIWIGSIDSAHDSNFLREKKIRSIINASGMEPTLNARDMYRKNGVDYYTLSEIEKVPYKSHYRVNKYLGDERFSKNGLTPRQFFKFMHRGCQMMNQPGFKFPVLIHCFTEEHQLLTNKGFMFLHEIEKYEGDDLLFASYDEVSKQLVYESYDLVINPHQQYDMVDMTQSSSIEMNECNNVSLVTTTGHRMYVNCGDDYQMLEASDLLSDSLPDSIKFMCRIDNGLNTKFNIESIKHIEHLGLNSIDKLHAFLELYGYWFRDQHHHQTHHQTSIVFYGDNEWIMKTIKTLGMVHNKDYKTDNFKTSIMNRDWLRFFSIHFFKDEIPEWIWKLGKLEVRSILTGMNQGDAKKDKNVIYTHSAEIRDLVVRLGLHAGYSCDFRYLLSPHSHKNTEYWMVSYKDDEDDKYKLARKRDIKKKLYTGRTWCVTVPHGFVIARRAHFDENKNCIVKASRSVITSNCHAGVNRSGSLIASYLMTKPRPHTYEKTVEMLEKANRRRNLDVLTNQDFKRSLKYFPIFMGTYDKVSPRTMARYKQLLDSYNK